MPVGVTVALIAVGVLYGFLNGFHDSASIVATAISSRAIRPRQALLLAAFGEFAGPFIFGVAVATTIGHEIVAQEAMTAPVLFAALTGAIVWNLATWLLGIPSSSSHALIGGLVGAVVMGYGLSAILAQGIIKTIVALLTSPIIGLVVGYLLMKLILWLGQFATPRVNVLFRRSQILTSLALGLSHGTNDGQKTMGIVAMALLSGGFITTFRIPTWVIALSAGAMALGMLTGAWRIIRTMGAKFYRIRPIHGFTVQTSSALVILVAAALGGPVSTTQVVSSSIVGVGSAERLSKVRWGVATDIALAWILTIPSSMLVAALAYIPFKAWLG